MSKYSTITCSSCKKTFQADPNANRVFCVHCGTEQQDIVFDGVSDPFILWLTDYVKITDGEDRRKALEEAKQTCPETGIEANLLDSLQAIWQLRYHKSRLRDMLWADAWMGELQNWLVSAKDGNPASERRRAIRSLDQFFNDNKLLKALDIDFLPPGLSENKQAPEYRKQYLLYAELLNLIYLYTKLCMNDKNYGSVLFGFGRHSDKRISEKITQEYVDLQLNLLKEDSETKAGYKFLIKALMDGFKMYFDNNFVLDY